MSMTITAGPGDKVMLARTKCGRDADKVKVKKHLEFGKAYTIERVVVSRFHTDVWLKEVPGVQFNSVFFDDFQVDEAKAEKRRKLFEDGDWIGQYDTNLEQLDDEPDLNTYLKLVYDIANGQDKYYWLNAHCRLREIKGVLGELYE